MEEKLLADLIKRIYLPKTYNCPIVANAVAKKCSLVKFLEKLKVLQSPTHIHRTLDPVPTRYGRRYYSRSAYCLHKVYFNYITFSIWLLKRRYLSTFGIIH